MHKPQENRITDRPVIDAILAGSRLDIAVRVRKKVGVWITTLEKDPNSDHRRCCDQYIALHDGD
jgi:hypothetical protein